MTPHSQHSQRPPKSGLLHFERRTEPLLPPRHYYRRQLRNAAAALGVIAVSLAIGVVGYHTVAGLGWLDSLLNASMILTGMGPVDHMGTPGAKVFASCYALFSGVAFLTSVGLLLAPAVHRVMHRFHLEDDRG